MSDPGRIQICYSRCWACQFGEHYDPPQWHTWADDEDVQHAAATGQPDPRSSRCGCPCANSPSPQADVAPCGEDAPSALSRDTATAEGVSKLPAPDAGGSS